MMTRFPKGHRRSIQGSSVRIKAYANTPIGNTYQYGNLANLSTTKEPITQTGRFLIVVFSLSAFYHSQTFGVPPVY